jgi:hypothetical protein
MQVEQSHRVKMARAVPKSFSVGADAMQGMLGDQTQSNGWLSQNHNPLSLHDHPVLSDPMGSAN